LLDGPVAAVADDAAEVEADDDLDPVGPIGLDRVAGVPPAAPELVAEVPDVDPVTGMPVVVTAEVAGFPYVVVVSVDVFVPVPRLTTPLRVTLPGVAAVCASAGTATAIENSIAKRTDRPMIRKRNKISVPSSTAPALLGSVVRSE
jgi:hypothetical protein